jgi:hypothetical protein
MNFFFPKHTFFPNSGELSDEFRVRVRVSEFLGGCRPRRT